MAVRSNPTEAPTHAPESHRAQTEKALAGFGSALPGCATCRTMTSQVSYGLGIWLVLFLLKPVHKRRLMVSSSAKYAAKRGGTRWARMEA